ncbi:hypothetical protein [Bifidobacterium sp. UBA744]|uniref:hypothetical protein n=1 Tax=Bifidobacterium sp. UBA744 TaxID=1946112 RepID=UPI0025BEE325|nr:hypothetical protein [Bifidobacterium sp. UBA744]
MDLSVFNDMVVEPGHYGRVTVIGKAAFKDGVFFDLLEVHGSLDAHHLTGNILTVDGAVTATGSIGVTCLNGSGDMRVAGDVRANRMQFTGILEVGGSLRVEDCLDVAGVLRKPQRIHAREVTVTGYAEMGALQATTTVLIRPLDTMMLRWQCFQPYNHRSVIGSIRCLTLNAKDVDCVKVSARNATLLGSTVVRSIRCLDTLVLDRSVSVGAVSGGCERRYAD